MNEELPEWYCQNCGEKGAEDDFTPTANNADHQCLNCGSVDVFHRGPDRRLSKEEFERIQRGCRDQGFGDNPEEDISKYPNDVVVVVVDGKMMPSWMAEVFGRMHKLKND